MQGVKMPLYEGEDGKLYYNFAQGLKVRMHGSDVDKNENYELEIVGCHYVGNTEYYDVEIDGRQLPQPLSANRIKYLVSRYGERTLEYGERRELPLLLEEVQSYYHYKERARAHAQSEASKLTEYVALKIAIATVNQKIGYAFAFEKNDEAAAYEEQRDELERRAADILTVHGISPSDVAEPEHCEICDDKGYVYNHICACALPYAHEIKEFCALERLKLKQLTNGIN